ncbi:uncharacterized protein PpBr36_10689 [Pyricularia pennisetigena]|uniref:uncharacterized protein n=1 Tax=Pyricularia pennisetigena TaxID=1578925 RepID=UPI0011543E09|nr:uncharacterized protein PpBr36_10689 [Pyricularia pennisetigena]TLS20825.1 hypothetical protein PpBr36_10689 [Pyricularia pennisetigena]
MDNIPTYDALPPVEGMPAGCAWGVFDKPGEPKDVYGTLNHLTPAVVAAAGAEVRDGVSISLNWPLTALNHIPLPGRRKTVHTVRSLVEQGMSSGAGLDDELEFNTQSSSQWDSLVHWAHQETGLSYNGFRAAADNVATSPDAPTVDKWHARGGVVARGVLVDFKRWAEANGREYHPFDAYRITVKDLEEVAAAQGVEFRPGDVLLVRTGVTEVWEAPSQDDFAKVMRGTISGLHGAEETVRWLWDRRFAAVACDNNGVEALPPVKEDGSVTAMEGLVLHPHCLGLLGMPLGELWDLRKLSEHCAKTGRYSFLLTSAPLNAAGLVGSPPNALAIF